MRRGLVLLLAGGCVPATSSPTTPAPPPVPGFDVTTEPVAWRGETLDVRATLPVPPAPLHGVDVWFGVTDLGVGRGSCTPALQGQCLSLAGNLTVFGPVTSAFGEALLRYEVDASHPTLDLGFQAAVFAGPVVYLSSATSAVVLDPPALYGTDGATGDLYLLDPLTGGGRAIANVGAVTVTGIASCGVGLAPVSVVAAGHTAAATDSTLYALDLGTGALTPIGPVGARVEGLACHPGSGKLAAISDVGELIDIDIFSGQGTIVGNPGLVAPGGLAWSTSAGAFHVVDTFDDTLYRIDLRPLAAVAVGPVVPGALTALAAHTGSQVLYGASASTGELVRIEAATGETRVIGPLPAALASLTF